MDSFERRVKTLVTPIFEKAANETSKNRMSVGGEGFSKDVYKSTIFFQPHNLRHYFDYDKASFSVLKPTSEGSGVSTVELKNNGREYFFRDFMGCNITVKKRQVEVKNNIDFKKWYKINLDKDAHSNLHVVKIRESIIVLKAFIKRFGGTSQFKLLNVASEDKFKSEAFIDLIPLKQRWHDAVSKKVYLESQVELSPALASNYISNQAALMESFNMSDWCEQNIKSLDDVRVFEPLIRIMSFENRLFLSNYLFERFGGGGL